MSESTEVGWHRYGRSIREGDLVIVFAQVGEVSFVYAKRGAVYQSRFGAFHHDDFIGKPYGSKIVSRVRRGWCFALLPTAELWASALPNRTQICQEWDQSIVVLRLGLRPGHVVVESGTGSGAMSTAILRTIAPHGHLHTFEFNKHRADAAREEFEKNGLGPLVTVRHRDVCGKAEGNAGGFGPIEDTADAVFLDLPEPWLAVPHARRALRRGRALASYSPCIEQVARTCAALRECGFHSVTTVELRLRQWNTCDVPLPTPDFGFRRNGSDGSGSSGAALAAAAGYGSSEAASEDGASAAAVAASVADASNGGEERIAAAATTAAGQNAPNGGTEAGAADSAQDADGFRAGQKRGRDAPACNGSSGARSNNGGAGCNGGEQAVRTMLCGKPAPSMRGHTAFLTFAVTAGDFDAALDGGGDAAQN